MGFFGSSSPSSPSSDSPSTSSGVGSTQGPTAEQSTLIKNQIIKSFQTEIATVNAKILIQKVNETCFTNCIPANTAPATSLSRTESSCLSVCMEKYLDAWNTTSKTYTSRLARSAPAGQGPVAGGDLGGLGGGDLKGPEVGKEMF